MLNLYLVWKLLRSALRPSACSSINLFIHPFKTSGIYLQYWWKRNIVKTLFDMLNESRQTENKWHQSGNHTMTPNLATVEPSFSTFLCIKVTMQTHNLNRRRVRLDARLWWHHFCFDKLLTSQTNDRVRVGGGVTIQSAVPDLETTVNVCHYSRGKNHLAQLQVPAEHTERTQTPEATYGRWWTGGWGLIFGSFQMFWCFMVQELHSYHI